MIKAGFDTDDLLIQHALERSAPGLVVEGMGMGHLPPAMMPGIVRALEEGVPVVITSRSPEGAVEPVYDFEGGGRDLAERGAIFARGIPAHKARIKLMVALAADPRPKTSEELRELFSSERDRPCMRASHPSHVTCKSNATYPLVSKEN